jgi:hypothetical protein
MTPPPACQSNGVAHSAPELPQGLSDGFAQLEFVDLGGHNKNRRPVLTGGTIALL